jgi:hypothetical protein
MNLDERIEALAQSVELLATMHKDNETQLKNWVQASEKRLQAHEKHMRRQDRHIISVLNMLLNHENRLRAIEGDDDDEPDSALV